MTRSGIVRSIRPAGCRILHAPAFALRTHRRDRFRYV